MDEQEKRREIGKGEKRKKEKKEEREKREEQHSMRPSILC